MEIRRLIPLALFSAYFIKTIISPIGYQEVCLLFVLGAVAAFYEYKSQDKKLVELEAKIDKQQKDFEEKAKEIEHLKSSVTGIKLSSGMRPLGNTGSR